jgi:parvulin-like peptidyl-prolyl isomerase
MVKKFYDDHPPEFMHPEAAKVRTILISKAKHSVEEARTLAGNLMKDLYGVRVSSHNDIRAISAAFAEAAAKSSEHATAASGGDLGWVTRDTLDPKVREAVFQMKPGAISGILETDAGLQLMLVEDHQDASAESYESARANIREYLIGANTQKIVEAVNRAEHEIRASSKVQMYPENVK